VILPENLLLAMSIKYAQRLDVHTLAVVTHSGHDDVEAALVVLEQVGLARRWGDGLWGLTSLGNLNRNHLTS
jgi:hypothetical protein